MKTNTIKERSLYTQGQRFAARVLCIVWLLASGSPEGVLATPKRQMVPATTASPGNPALASTPPTPPPGGILQLSPDAPGAFWGGSVASSPALENAFQQRMSQEAAPDKGLELLRTSLKAFPASENFSFQVREGESVRFSCQMGQWHAEVSSHIGSASRRAVLPVVCSRGEDVASSLEVLSKYPSWYSQRQIHVLDRNLCPTLGEVVYVGELGLKGGGEGGDLKRQRSSSNDNPPQDRKKLCSAEPKLNPTEADSPSTVDQLKKRLKTLASDPQIDQQPDKLAELGAVLLKLAKAKQEEKRDSAEDLSPYTDAAILYQHVLSICAQKADKLDGQEASTLEDSAYQGLAQIQASMLARAKGVAPRATRSESVKALRARIEEDKRALEATRTKARKEVEDLVKYRDKQGSEREVQDAEAIFIKDSIELFETIAEASKDLLANFYQAGEEELKAAGIERPCTYAIMGLGSVALQQTTPYSDLEFAILMEGAQDEAAARTYLRNLTHLVHFRVINLGETVLPFSEYKISLDHLGRKGLNFDLGGKTPLGRKDKDYELIQPVTKMAEYMQNEGGKMEQMDKLLPYILESTCHIYGDNSLHASYEATQASFLQEQAASGQYAYQQRIAKKLLQGVKDLGRQQPGDISRHRPSLDPIDAGKLYNVKEEIYRLPDRLLYSLAMYYDIRPQSAWDAVDKLLDSGKIHAEAARHLKYMASFAAMLRLETYLHHGQQNEQLSLRGSLSQGASGEGSSQAAHELLMLPPEALQEDGSLFRYYYTALPLHQQMEEFFELLHLRQQMRGKPVLDRALEAMFGTKGKYAAPQEGTYFRSEPFYDTSCAVKVSVYNRLQQYEAAKECAAKHHEEVKKRYFYNHAKLARYHHNLGVACYHLGEFEDSFDHFKCSLKLSKGVYPEHHPEIAKVLQSQGIAYYTRKDFEQSRQCFAKSLQLLQAFYNDNHPETAQMLLSLGEVDEAMGNYEASLKHKADALEMLQSLYPEHHPAKAHALLSLGDAYAATGQLEASLDHKKKSLKMFKDLYGKSHPEVARALLSLGDVHAALENFEASQKHKKESLEMFRALYGSSHPEVARALLSLGESYALSGKLEESRQRKQEALEMLQDFYDKDHPEVNQALRSLHETNERLIQGEGSSRQDTGHTLRPVRTVYPQHLTLLPTPRYGKEPAGENTLLRKYYSKTDFPYVKSLFEEHRSRHVQNLECQLMLFEKKLIEQDKEAAGDQEDHVAPHHESHELNAPIEPKDLLDLFIKPGDPTKGVRCILLTGDPGAGKTTLSRQLAYQWSQGRWGKEFHTLYLLPVRNLQQSEYDGTRYNREKTLSTAIVNNCFSHDLPATEAEYNRLRAHIEQELKKSTTLVILDGLNERAGASEEILRQAQAGSHKLLMLSRPYSIEVEQRLAELKIKHVGFNQEQLQAYVQAEVSDSERAAELLGYIDKNENIGSIAHIPVNLQILCVLWQDKGYDVREAAQQGSLPGLYRLVTEFTWRRYKERTSEGVSVRARKDLFDKLGQIALRALSEGEVLISPGLIDRTLSNRESDAERVKTRCKDAGLLLLHYVREDADRERVFYEFPHPTLQEYFAGCTLAGKFLSTDEDEREKASDFFSEHKYESQYGQTLSFMAGEVSRVKGVRGIKELLNLLGEGEREIVGLQHMLLQLRVTHEWLCIASDQEAKRGMKELEDTFHLQSSLKEWFVRAFEHVRLEGYKVDLPGYKLLDLLKSSLQTFGSIASHAPGLVELFNKEAQGPSASVRLAAISSLGAAMAGTYKKAQSLLEDVVEHKEHEAYEVQKAAITALKEAKREKTSEEVDPEILKEAEALIKSLCTTYQNSVPYLRDHAEKFLIEAKKFALSAVPGRLDITLLHAYQSWPLNVKKNIYDSFKLLDRANHSTFLKIIETLLQAIQEVEDARQDSPIASLFQAIQSWSFYVCITIAKQLFKLLTEATPEEAKNPDGDVRQTAVPDLGQDSLEELLERYWSTRDDKLIPYITPRLYHTPLVIAKSVRSGPQRVSLYAAAGQPSKWQQPQGVLADFERHVQDAVSQLSQVESRLSARVDKSVWEHYFGAVGEEPELPDDLEAILDSPCPFWPEHQIRDTHLLVLIPAKVNGKPLTLNYLGELVKSPKKGYGTKYRYYSDYVCSAIGSKDSGSSYWVLMTKDVLPESRDKRYEDQCALVEPHQGYAVPKALEAAVVMLLHYVRSGERLYGDTPWTWTGSRDKSTNGDPVVVGGFSSEGPFIRPHNSEYRFGFVSGVAALRKFDAAVPKDTLVLKQ